MAFTCSVTRLVSSITSLKMLFMATKNLFLFLRNSHPHGPQNKLLLISLGMTSFPTVFFFCILCLFKATLSPLVQNSNAEDKRHLFPLIQQNADVRENSPGQPRHTFLILSSHEAPYSIHRQKKKVHLCHQELKYPDLMVTSLY